jgi:hypothetical protein
MQPLMPTILRWSYQLLGGGDLAGPLWWVLLKLPAIVADAGIALLVWRLAHRRIEALWLVGSVAFNPALIYLSAWWGQYESVYMLGALAALVAAQENRPMWAGLALGLGAMVKLQAAVIAPVVLLIVLAKPTRGVSLLLMGLGLVLALTATLGPFAVTGQGGLIMHRLVAVVAGPGWLTINALNVWYLLTRGTANWVYNTPLVWPDSAPLVAGVPARTVGTSLLAVWTIGALALIWRSLTKERAIVPLLGGALLYLGIFLFPTQAHERYAFGAVVLLAGAAASMASREDRMRLSQPVCLYILITMACTLNLIWAAPFAPWLDGWLAGSRTAGMLLASVFLAAALWGGYVLSRRKKLVASAE